MRYVGKVLRNGRLKLELIHSFGKALHTVARRSFRT